MSFFVEEDSIVRCIWGKSDTILFIFAGAAAEFALNKAVDWLYFTGKLPSDPLGRLFSTVEYARKIVFATTEDAHKEIDAIKNIHRAVEQDRGSVIPDWAYRDVLFMLIYYSIAAYELLERPLKTEEKEDVYKVFYQLGKRMELEGLPLSYAEWLPVRESHLEKDLDMSSLTTDLFAQYKKHLGSLRYKVLIEGQKMVVPQQVRIMLGFTNRLWLQPLVRFYKLSRKIKLDGLIKYFLIPMAFKGQVKSLDIDNKAWI